MNKYMTKIAVTAFAAVVSAGAFAEGGKHKHQQQPQGNADVTVPFEIENGGSTATSDSHLDSDIHVRTGDANAGVESTDHFTGTNALKGHVEGSNKLDFDPTITNKAAGGTGTATLESEMSPEITVDPKIDVKGAKVEGVEAGAQAGVKDSGNSDAESTVKDSGNSNSSADGSGNSANLVKVEGDRNRYINVDPLALSAAASHNTLKACVASTSGGFSGNLFEDIIEKITNRAFGFNFNRTGSGAVEITGDYKTHKIVDGELKEVTVEGSWTVPEWADNLTPAQRKDVIEDMPSKGAALLTCLASDYQKEFKLIVAHYNGVAKVNDIIGAHEENIAAINAEKDIKIIAIKGANRLSEIEAIHECNQGGVLETTRTTTGEGENAETVVTGVLNKQTLAYRGDHGEEHCDFEEDRKAVRAIITTPIVPPRAPGLLMDHE